MYTLATCYHSSFIAFDTRYRRGKLSQISARKLPIVYNWDLNVLYGTIFLTLVGIWGGKAKKISIEEQRNHGSVS